MSAHEQWADTAGAYVLGALDDREREAFETHMAGCAACRREVEQLRVAADALPAGVPQFAPPPELKDRIMAIVNAEAELLAAAGDQADRPPAPAPRRARRPVLAWLARPAVALACALALIVAGVGAGVLLRGDGDMHTVVADTQAPGAQVELRMSDDSATLVARHMPPPPSGRIYQVWLKRPGRDPQPTSVLWSVDAAGSADVAVPGAMEGVESVLVTDEPEGGSRTPTKPPVISARIA